MCDPWHGLGSRAHLFENAEINALAERAADYARAGVTVHFSGAAGLGKTSLAFRVAHDLGQKIAFMAGNEWMSRADLVGREIGSTTSAVVDKYVQSVRRTESQTRTDWQSSVLALAMEHGHTLIYDEFTRATPEANAMLLSVLEEGVLISTDPASPKRIVRAHPRFRVLLTSNPMDYIGVNSAPDALLDRVVTFRMEEFSPATIAAIVNSRTGLGLPESKRLVSLLATMPRGPDNEKFSTLRSALLIGRIAAYRTAVATLSDDGLLEIVADVLSGRGIDIHAPEIATALKTVQAA